MSERCPVCFHFQRFCNCPAVLEAERIVAEAGLSQWLRPSAAIDLSAYRDLLLPPLPPGYSWGKAWRWFSDPMDDDGDEIPGA